MVVHHLVSRVPHDLDSDYRDNYHNRVPQREDPSIHGVKYGGITKDGLGGDSGPVSNVPSFAKNEQDKPVKKVVKITKMRNSKVVDGASVAILLEVVEEVSSRFANILYGYFIGKRLAFPLLENYVKNT
nr:zinc knuckle CX2CX4HX4C [Tanacetum cinerariifolium]